MDTGISSHMGIWGQVPWEQRWMRKNFPVISIPVWAGDGSVMGLVWNVDVWHVNILNTHHPHLTAQQQHVTMTTPPALTMTTATSTTTSTSHVNDCHTTQMTTSGINHTTRTGCHISCICRRTLVVTTGHALGNTGLYTIVMWRSKVTCNRRETITSHVNDSNDTAMGVGRWGWGLGHRAQPLTKVCHFFISF